MPKGPRFRTAKASIVHARFKSSAARPWWSKYEPADTDEVAMHKAKLERLESELTARGAAGSKGSKKLLLVSGPAGAAKSTAVRSVCRSSGRRILEWHTPEHAVGETSMTDSFGDFLVGASIQGSKCVVLVDDLPNVFHAETKRRFLASLVYWVGLPDPPLLVVVFTEIENCPPKDLLVLEQMFAELLARPEVASIKVNPVNASLMTKCLRSACQREGVPPAQASRAIDAIKHSGDVRFAFNMLELLCRGEGAGKVPVSHRDSSTELFHGIGKVVHGSKATSDLFALDGLYSDEDIFNLTLLENYLTAKNQRMSIADAAACADWLSIADTGHDLRYLGPLGVRCTIARATLVADRGSFVPLRFTQYRSSLKERLVYREYTARYMRDLRGAGVLADFGDALMQRQLGFQDVDSTEFFLSDTDSDMDSS